MCGVFDHQSNLPGAPRQREPGLGTGLIFVSQNHGGRWSQRTLSACSTGGLHELADSQLDHIFAHGEDCGKSTRGGFRTVAMEYLIKLFGLEAFGKTLPPLACWAPLPATNPLQSGWTPLPTALTGAAA